MMRRFVTGVALVAVIGCKNPSVLGEADGEDPVADGDRSVGASKDADAPMRSPLTPAKLSPIISELGAAGVTPSAIVVSFATPIIESDESGRVTSKTVLEIKPPVSGTLTYLGTSQLRFLPQAGFESATTYTIELKKVETRDGVLEPPGNTTWKHSFETPAFQLIGWAPTSIDLKTKIVMMEVRFSAPVLANIARNLMVLTIDGQPVANVTVMPSPSRAVANQNVVTLQLSDPRLQAGSKLGLALRAELLALNGAKAAPKTIEHVVKDDKIAAIRGAQFVEGANGYYLEVACNDAAAPKGSRSAYYDGEYASGLSQRCQLSDESLSQITFDPPVDKPYITSGKSGFRVFGSFKRGVYRVGINAGARTIDGGVVTAPYSRSYAITARKAQLSFAGTGRYLPRSAWTNLGIKHLNLDEANLVVRQIPPENLVFWLGNTASDLADDRTSNVILKTTVPLRGDADVQTMSWKDVASMLPSTTKGVLELKLAGTGASATSRLLLTDLSLVAKKTSVPDKPWLQTVKVWALDMQSNELLDGVQVQLVRKSGKVVAQCNTSGEKGCTLDVKPSDPDEAEPFALIARLGEDLTYLRYSDLRADVTESSTSGLPYVATTPYRAAMYADRGVYRPGETAHVVAILRDAKDKAPPAGLPVDVKVYDPKAKIVKKQTMKTNVAGVIAIDHALPNFADTGHWRIQIDVADKALTTYAVQVEEFVPERMKVSIAAQTAEALIGSKLTFEVAAQYLFGGSAMDSGVELLCTVEPERFEPTENNDLVYGIPPKGKAVALPEARGQLDLKGQLAIACPQGDATTAFEQTMSVAARASVLEAGSGRATVKVATATLHPEKFYIGLKTKTPIVASGKTFTIEGMLVDWQGKPVSQGATKLDIELEHLETDYGYAYDEDTGEASYDKNLRHVPEGKLTAQVTNGKFQFDVTPGDADIGYVVKVKAGKAETHLVLDGVYPYEYYSDYGDSDRVDQTPRPAKPTKLKLELPKKLEVGTAATVKVRAPYKGKLLWTIETDRVVKTAWMDTPGGETSWTFTLDRFAPNVYVSAFLVKDPHLESAKAFLPDRAFGLGSVRVTPKEFTQDVKLTAPKDVRSSSPLSITLDLGPITEPTFATIAVVDEGVLSLTSFPTPDPNNQLFSKRALGVETFETIGWTMLHQPAGASSKTGGGDEGIEAEEGGADQGRVQPVKPVALFSGIVQVGADGKVTVPFQLPTYRGQVRVMAITASASKVGRAEAQVTVKDPLVVQMTFPRFVTHEDEIKVPVFLTNLSGGPLEISVRLESEHLAVPGIVMKKEAPPPLTFGGKSATTLKLDHGRSDTVVFAAKAAIPIGAAKIRVVATAKGAFSGTVQDEQDIPFLPAGPRDRAITKIQLQPGTLDLSTLAALRGWVPTSETTTFWMTSNPYGESFEHLKYLIHYPYGCIEQTTSATRPLLYIGALAEQVDDKLAAVKREDMILSGIARIFSMQTPAGGFGYWPGATDPEDWATAYATHFLLDAKAAGYAIPEDRLREVVAWIDTRAAAYERGLGKYDRHAWAHYDGQVQAYFHYVLAIANKGKKARILKLISDYERASNTPATPKGEQLEDLYMLKAALYRAGDQRYKAELKTIDASPITLDRSNWWSFYSDRRRRGMQLSIFFDLFKNDPAGEPLAQRVAQSLVGQTSGYYTTQELVWGVTGLGKWVNGQAAKGVGGGTITADGTKFDPRATKAKTNDKTWSLHRASEYKQLSIDVPQSAAGMWLVVRSEGVRGNALYKTGGNGMLITRTFRNQEGEVVDTDAEGAIKLGDVLFVEVDLRNASGASILNIALVDRLPAGFEIENPRLGRGVKLEWAKAEDLWAVDFQNMRDDRIEAFGHLAPNTAKKIIYSVRAVTSGRFSIPPVEAEAMYDPTLWARAPGGVAVIGGPWTGKTI